MSDFLFQNISNVFHAPQEVVDIIKQFPAFTEKDTLDITPETEKDLYLNEEGEVEVPEPVVEEKKESIFGEKIYDISDKLTDAVETLQEEKAKEDSKKDDSYDHLKQAFEKEAVKKLVDTAKTEYGKDMKPSDQTRLTNKLTHEAGRRVDILVGQHKIDTKKLENEKEKKIKQAETDEQIEQIEQSYQEKQEDLNQKLNMDLEQMVDEYVDYAATEIVQTVETSKKEMEKASIEAVIKDHLRGFSRTIPSFLMAYGVDENNIERSITLDNFDQIVPDDVFKEVTSITLDQFRFLRDGGPYKNEETGEMDHFDGDLFDGVVFNDSVREFMTKKDKLSDYFDEKNKGDIFDYIPPQKTNQIFTPKWVVKKMVDELEEENPGCFDDLDKTFIDLYMKSGLYPAEIIKRLYQNEAHIQAFPDKNERLKHIIEKQVYGLAPTEIIYRISKNFILGFDFQNKISSHNFRKEDSLKLIKEGKLEERLEELFPENKNNLD
jgi:hypothetical protein